MKAFVTGSRVYGTPTKESDLDLVIFCGADTSVMLMDHDEVSQNEDAHVSAYQSVRFGRLNIILCGNEKEYSKWLRAKERCVQERPVTRKRAIAIDKEEFKK